MKMDNRYSIIIIIVLFMMLFTFNIFGILLFLVGLITYLISKHGYKKKNRKVRKFDIQYFRDDLEKISPSYISYIMDFGIELKKDVAAHILKLYIDGYIKEENNRFVVTDKSEVELKESDKCLLDFVNSNFKAPYFLSTYQKAIENELLEQEYITTNFTKTSAYSSIVKIIFGFVFCVMVLNILSMFGVATNLTKATTVVNIIFGFLIAFIFMMGMFFFVPIIIGRTLASHKYNRYRRTKKGEDFLEKVYGLKNFLIDFTNIKDRKFQDVYLQEHYLVYALTLGVNDKIDDEILQKILRQISNS